MQPIGSNKVSQDKVIVQNQESTEKTKETHRYFKDIENDLKQIFQKYNTTYSFDNLLKLLGKDYTKEKVLSVLREKFKPEFLNRIDETIFFKALNLQQLSKIVDIQMDYLRTLLKEQELTFEISDDAKEFLATQGFNPVYGARPLKRVIRQMVENPLSKKILAREFSKGDNIKIELVDDKLSFNK